MIKIKLWTLLDNGKINFDGSLSLDGSMQCAYNLGKWKVKYMTSYYKKGAPAIYAINKTERLGRIFFRLQFVNKETSVDVDNPSSRVKSIMKRYTGWISEWENKKKEK